MAKYISLIRFTEKGASSIKDSTSRAEAFDKIAEKAGISILGQYWTIGSYDGVLIIEADDEFRALHWLTELVSEGNVKSETLQAFDGAEFKRIVSG